MQAACELLLQCISHWHLPCHAFYTQVTDKLHMRYIHSSSCICLSRNQVIFVHRSNAAAGASVEQYYLAAKAESGVQPAPQGSLQLMKAEALKQPDGTLQAQFTLQLPEHVAASNYIVDCM